MIFFNKKTQCTYSGDSIIVGWNSDLTLGWATGRRLNWILTICICICAHIHSYVTSQLYIVQIWVKGMNEPLNQLTGDWNKL